MEYVAIIIAFLFISVYVIAINTIKISWLKSDLIDLKKEVRELGLELRKRR